MAHNPFIRPSNDWSGDAAIATSEWEDLAEDVYQSINGDEGGTWAPAAVITIGGLGLTVTGPSQFGELQTFTATGACAFIDAGGLTFYDSTLCVFAESSTLGFIGDANLSIAGDVDVTVSTTHTVQWSAPINFSAGSHAYSGNTISGSQTRTGATTYSGIAARRVGRTVSNADVNVTYGNEVDTVFYGHTNNTNRSMTLRTSISGSSPAAVAGERLRVFYRRTPTATGTLAISCESGPALVTFGTNGSDVDAHDNRGCADFEFDGTQWRVASFWGTGTSVSALFP